MRLSPSPNGGDVTSAHPWHSRPAEEVVQPWHVAVVQAADGIRFVAFASTRAAVVKRVAQYAASRAADVLWEPDADAVRRAMHIGDFEGAVDRYFRATGKRWDAEGLSVVEMTAPGSQRRSSSDGRCSVIPPTLFGAV